MTPLGLHDPDAYLRRLFSSHDYTITLEVLDLDEQPQGTAVFLDGQVNLIADAAIRRTASLTISDPEGALDFADASTWSPRSIWADRLLRIRHTIEVPGVGPVSAIVFIGTPSTIDRSGADVTVELQDKTALAIRGCPPLTVKKGMNAVEAIRKILGDRTGEFRFRLPKLPRRLNRPYSVGWSDDASPWAVASTIASRQLGMQLIYSADGYVVLRKRPTQPALTVPHVTGLPATSADFTAMTNWVRVSGHKASKTKNQKGGGSVTTTSQPQAVAQIAAGKTFSPEWLARKGVPRYWPTLVEDDALRTLKRVKEEAARQLEASDRLQDTPSVTCVPFFHGDVDDLVTVQTPDGPFVVRLGDCSIPLGVAGEMTIGAHRWVSQAQPSRTRGRVVRTRKVHHKKKDKADSKKGGGK